MRKQRETAYRETAFIYAGPGVDKKVKSKVKLTGKKVRKASSLTARRTGLGWHINHNSTSPSTKDHCSSLLFALLMKQLETVDLLTKPVHPGVSQQCALSICFFFLLVLFE